MSNSKSISRSKSKAKNKTKRTLMNQLHIYTILLAQIVASAILLAFFLWLFLRLPEPELHVRGFTIDALDKSKTTTLLHYNITLHNPDLYKSINYTVLIMRITYSGYHSKLYGATINFDPSGEGIHQGPRATTLLANHTANYTDPSVWWVPTSDLLDLQTAKTFILLRFVMEIRVLAFDRITIGTIQRMRTAEIYFDDNGKAFIDSHGLRFK